MIGEDTSHTAAWQPLVSVAIPTFNRAALVERAIDSVLAQTYPHIELIVVDDGSTDGTADALARYQRRGALTVVRHSANRGVTAAKNTGIDAMSGVLGGILDSDDELLPDGVETLIKVFRQHGETIGMVFGDCVDSITGARTGQVLSSPGEVTFRDAVTGCIQGEFWGLWKRSVLGTLRFDPTLPGGSESLVWHELYRRARVFYVDWPVRKYARRSADSVTRANLEPTHLQRSRLMYERYLEQFGDDMRRFDRQAYVKHLQLIALWHLLSGERRDGLARLWQSVRAGASGGQIARAAVMMMTPRALLQREFIKRYERALTRDARG